MSDVKSEPRDEGVAIDNERSRILLVCFLALTFLIVAFFLLEPPPTAVVVVAIIVLVGFKKAAVRYRALGRTKADKRDSSRS